MPGPPRGSAKSSRGKSTAQKATSTRPLLKKISLIDDEALNKDGNSEEEDDDEDDEEDDPEMQRFINDDEEEEASGEFSFCTRVHNVTCSPNYPYRDRRCYQKGHSAIADPNSGW